MSPTLNLAHRGASGHAPENTFAAFDLAVDLGVDYLELDIHLSRDGQPVVIHDETLDRTVRGAGGPVGNHRAAELAKCDAGSWFNELHPAIARRDFRQQRIPSLRNVFERYGRRVGYCIELKRPESYPQMEEKVLDLLDCFGLIAGHRAFIQSRSESALRHISRIRPEVRLVQLFDGLESWSRVRARLDGVKTYASGIGPASAAVVPELVLEAHRLGIDVLAYTVNDPAEMARLVDIGVDGIFSDWPDLLGRMLKSQAA